jgi:hypothetical protein
MWHRYYHFYPWLWYGGAMMGALSPADNVADLPVSKPRAPQRHALGPAEIVPAILSTSSQERHEKTCRNCGVVRVTVIGGIFPRLWRLPDGSLLLAEPACEAADALRVPA